MQMQNMLVSTPAEPDLLHQTRVNRRPPSGAKIALLRSLFCGREDVHPRRFESRRTGRAGYSPACRRLGIDPFAYFRDLFERISTQPALASARAQDSIPCPVMRC